VCINVIHTELELGIVHTQESQKSTALWTHYLIRKGSSVGYLTTPYQLQ